MGWGLEVNGIYLSRIAKSDIENKLKESREVIEFLKNELIALSSYTNPTYHDGTEQISLIEHVLFRVPAIVEELEEECFIAGVLQHAKENMDDVKDT